MADFTMPALGADMDEGTLLEWRVTPGDEIRKGEIIAVVDTAKSAIEVEAFHTGTVERLVTDVGETVPVGTVLATITETPAGRAAPAPGEAAPAPAPAPAPAARKRRAAPPVTPLVRHAAAGLGVDLATVPGTGRGGSITRADVERAARRAERERAARRAEREQTERERAARERAAREPARPGRPPARARRGRATPLARRVAADLGVDLAGVTGTGPQGAIREEDVRRAATAPPAAGAGVAAGAGAPAEAGEAPGVPAAREAPLTREQRAEAMRQAIGRLMARSKREVPHYYVTETVDLAAATAWLRRRNRDLPVSQRLVPAALLLKAAALAARDVPQLNGYWSDDHFAPAGAVHLGVAVSLRGGGLVTPAIHDAAALPLGELMARLRDLVNRARGGRLRRAELTEATITVTNLGDQGVESVTGVIYPPQVALVGFGKVVERPWAVGGLLGVRPVVVATLAADHRATDGYTGARFLSHITDSLQRPEEL